MRYALGALAIVVIAFIAIFAVVNHNPGANTSNTVPKKDTTRLTSLVDTSGEVSMTIRGRITGDDTFRSIRIRVNANERVVEVLDGYNQTIERSQSFPNNSAAFTQLLYALDNSGYTRSQTPVYSDSRGVCPTGNVTFYDFTDAEGKKHELWATTCGSTLGNYAGSSSQSKQVLQAQITGYNKFVTGVYL